jgi:hypothetical protein
MDYKSKVKYEGLQITTVRNMDLSFDNFQKVVKTIHKIGL